ncbi:Uncharacterized protein BM_BM13432 [Brugia malayi]|uniref:Bm13432 n=1 Tax=Brugia malayi TaxID=6279 RepID=A0A0J9XSB4_BRUMA|nr:Uncharacterized protein BM_BM13432 [Brugia malayi]CDP94611.1 Bm13432 [Brugia malayi]VIO86796.1 Uncharacterized protein BM_BM13432 [Brugia malayi]
MLISLKLWSLVFIRVARILFTQDNRSSNRDHEFYESFLPCFLVEVCFASGIISTRAVERYECGDSAIRKLYMVYG